MKRNGGMQNRYALGIKKEASLPLILVAGMLPSRKRMTQKSFSQRKMRLCQNSDSTII